jgi:hypothetical protein
MSKSIIEIRRKRDGKILRDEINDACQTHNIYDGDVLVESNKDYNIGYSEWSGFYDYSEYEELADYEEQPMMTLEATIKGWVATEDYVSFETAKLLKEKEFNRGGCKNSPHYYYNTNGEFSGPSWDSEYPAPTLQMAMKWLREMYDIHVVPRKDFFNGTYTGMIYDGRRENVFDKEDYIALVGYETYEKACEAAIKYCLEKLI